MDIEKKDFAQLRDELPVTCEGIVMLGCDGDLYEWVGGVTSLLNQEGIVNEPDSTKVWQNIYQLTTTGGRNDLVLILNNNTKFNLGKLAIWRLRFGDCSWWSDYIVNYVDQH